MRSDLQVHLGDRSYKILIGEGLLQEAGSLMQEVLRRPRVIIITDEQVAKIHLTTLTVSCEKAGVTYNTIILPAGESTKNFSNLETLIDKLLSFAPDRNSTIVALGGGVIGDIGGFAASVLLRGLDFIQIPTTLLAQVDSSVGGKTGINTPQGKNLVGSFYQPKLVIIDTKTLITLPKRELLAGYAEVVKYGIINDYPFFVWLEEYGQKAIDGDMQALAHIIHESCKTKAEIVASDELENGIRAILNFGHTLGHALEAELGYNSLLLHGEAVAIGMMLAMQISVNRGICEQEDLDRVRRHFIELGLPISPQAIDHAWDAQKLIANCYKDKKVRDRKLTFILTPAIGKTIISHDVNESELEAVLANIL